MSSTRPSLRDLARAWIVVSTQSVGGGPSTLFLMRREIVNRRGWVSTRQFLEDYALAKMSLGINLVALAGLVGLRTAGLAGVLVSVAVLLVPAAAITVMLTAGYVLVRDEPFVRAALTGIAPAAAGMTAGMGFTFIQQSVRRGWPALLDWGFASATFAAGLALGATPVVVIAVGIAVGGLLLRGQSSRASGDPAS
ncbi:MAG TPA: chromate transporter [Candidatus Acidoferrales bacterium]|nr:chromate transporter [Candidatus Acidoferrales bacterium]